MHRSRVVGLVLASLLALACSDDDREKKPPLGLGGGGGTGGGSAGAGGDGAGNVIADTECAAPAAVAVTLYADGTGPHLDTVAGVGTRLVAAGEAGIVFFDADGQNLDASPTVLGVSPHVLASEGDKVAVAAYDGDWLFVQRFDESGAALDALSGVSQLKPEDTGIAATASSGVPIVWAHQTRLYGRTRHEGTMSDVYDVMIGAYRTYVDLRVAARGEEVGVAWGGDESLGAYQSWFTRITGEGPVGDKVKLHEATERFELIDLVATDTGYVVAFTGGYTVDFQPLLLTLDEVGIPQGEPVRLDGAFSALGMASRGDGFAVVAGRASGELEMRAFAPDLTPLGPWVCLGSSYDAGRTAGITRHGSGYAILHTTSDSGIVLHRTDDTGEGAL